MWKLTAIVLRARSPLCKLNQVDNMHQLNENKYLYFKVKDFYERLKENNYKHPIDRAKALEDLANLAWDEVDDICEYQSSIRIDP